MVNIFWRFDYGFFLHFTLVPHTYQPAYRMSCFWQELLIPDLPNGEIVYAILSPMSTNSCKISSLQINPEDNNNSNNNNNQDNAYGAVIMAEPLREFTRFI